MEKQYVLMENVLVVVQENKLIVMVYVLPEVSIILMNSVMIVILIIVIRESEMQMVL